MKKIKLLTPLMGLIAIAGGLIPLASCSCKKEETTIPSEAFEVQDVTLKGFKKDFDYSKYTKLVIPSNVKVIGTNAFNGLFTSKTQLTQIVLPNNIEAIRTGAFVNNPNVTVYDFSGFDGNSIYKLTIEPGAFAFDTSGIYSYVKFNDDWSEQQKIALKNKLISGGIPAWCFIKQTTGNVEINSEAPKEQTANAGEAVNAFDVKGHYGNTLKYKTVLTAVDASEGVDIQHEPETTTSSDYKQLYVHAKMVPKVGHSFINNDYITYKVTLICYSGSEETNDYKAQWSETIDGFKLTYNNILTNVEYIPGSLTKSEYKYGETFDPTGLSIKAKYSNGKEEIITYPHDGLSTSLDGHVFTENDVKTQINEGIVFYKFEDITIQNVFNISMQDSLIRIELDLDESVFNYQVGETINKEDFIIDRIMCIAGWGIDWAYVEPQEFDITCDTLDLTKPFTDDDIGTHTLTLTHTYYGDTRTATCDIKIYPAAGNFNGVNWYEVAKVCADFEKVDNPTVQNAWRLCSHLNTTVTPPAPGATARSYLLSKLLGLEGTILLNGVEHKVRCIDAMHDVDTKGKTVALTFELQGVISDADGAMWCLWDSDDNKSYNTGLLFKNLNSTNSVSWYRSGTKLATTKSAYTMLSNAGIAPKQVVKQVATGDPLIVTNYNCYCFPLTYTELAKTGGESIAGEGTVYEYWKNQSSFTKQDIKGVASPYWIGSPNTATPTGTDKDYAWFIDASGNFSRASINNTYTTSFAFCI